MLHGRLVTLRERRRSDLEIVHRELRSDVVTASLVDVTPWRPVSLARLEADFDRSLSEPPDPAAVPFTVQERGEDTGPPVGVCLLWGIDLHNGTAHLGLQVVPSQRGRGFGGDIVRVLCHYAFVVRGLHRVGLETLASNAPMRAAALRAGFVEEGRAREMAYVLGERVDEVSYGLLRRDWRPDPEAGV
jgi:RimJ/RimL family protein N-acetyltransferase